MVDPSGAFPILLKRVRRLIENIAIAIVVVFEKIREDIKNSSIKNDNEQVVLDSHYFSLYKGNIVIRHSLPGTSCAMFGIIFLNKNETRISTVKHEWGHTQQEKIMGIFNYCIYIGIPSYVGYKNNVSRYYAQPWEHSADVLGGVHRSSSSYDMTDDEAMDYVNRHSRNSTLPIPIPLPLIWP
jgi:hypothetical protein